jgi:hypothetical protein
MKQQLINYMVKPDKVEENVQLIQNVFKELKVARIHGLKYSVYKMGENVFVHIAQFETPDSQTAFMELDSFKAFRENISARQLEKPIVNPIVEIASFSTIERC